MSATIRNVSTKKTHEAFMEVVEAIAALEKVKIRLADLHYKLKMVDDYQYLLDHVGEFCAPSDDAHEQLYTRLEQAKETIRVVEEGKPHEAMQRRLAEAYLCIERANELLK